MERGGKNEKRRERGERRMNERIMRIHGCVSLWTTRKTGHLIII